jgi:hypothetical protein
MPFSVFDQVVQLPPRRVGGQRPGEPKVRAGHEARPLTMRRVALGLTQADLAELAGLSTDTLGRIEMGRRPHARNRRRLLDVLRQAERALARGGDQ